MDFCHISPSQYLNPLEINNYKSHLLLAHLIEDDDIEYIDYYRHLPVRSEKTVILDNSAFELYRRNLPMFDGAKLLDIAARVTADYIVMPDYPGEHSSYTIRAANHYGPEFKDAGYKTFFVPQSEVGDLEDYIQAFAWAAQSPLVDYIGMSILGIPNAFGVDGNDIQRLLSRPHMFNLLGERGLLQMAKYNGKKIHCLGMTDGPREVDLMASWVVMGMVDSWDSSAAVWAGIEGVRFDNSPTGLIDGKVKSHVDFNIAFDETKVDDIMYNMTYIDGSVQAINNMRQR